MDIERDEKNITTDTEKLELLNTAKELASRKSNPEPRYEYYARLALEAHKEYNISLICMRWHLKKENNMAKSLKTAKKLASRDSKPKPLSEYFADSSLLRQTYNHGNPNILDDLGYMEAALKLEKNQKRLLEIETTSKKLAEKLASRNSNPETEPCSEYYGKAFLKKYEEYNKFLIYMREELKLKNHKGKDYDNYLPKMKEMKWPLIAEKRRAAMETAKNTVKKIIEEIIEEYSNDYSKDMALAIEIRNNRETETLLETAKNLSSRHQERKTQFTTTIPSQSELESELFAKKAIEFHLAKNIELRDLSLLYMKKTLSKLKETKLNNNPGPDQPTLQALREKRKEETLKEQEQKIQPQIKRGRSR